MHICIGLKLFQGPHPHAGFHLLGGGGGGGEASPPNPPTSPPKVLTINIIKTLALCFFVHW